MTIGTHSEPWESQPASRNIHRGKMRWKYQMVQDLVTDYLHHLEGLHRGDRVHEHVTVNSNEVFRVQYTIFILGIPLLDIE